MSKSPHHAPPLVDEDIRVIFLGSDTDPDEPLELPRAAAALQAALAADGLADALPLHADPYADFESLHRILLRAPRAQVLHLSGHGHSTRGVVMYDAEGRRRPVSGEALVDRLKRFRNIRLVVLDACHQLTHARDLARLVDCVIATSAALHVRDGRYFMRSLYTGLAHGDSVDEAFRGACDAAKLDAVDADVVVLESRRPYIDPRYVRLDPIAGARVGPDSMQLVRTRLARVVNPRDDLVIWANVPDWRAIVPHAPGSPPPAIEIQSPEGGWQRHLPSDDPTWSHVAGQITALRHRIGPATRLHVAVKLPYSLQALLARCLEAMNREVIFYQESPLPGADPADPKRWQPWGPGAAELMPLPRRTPVFAAINAPETPSRHPCDIAVAVAVTRPIPARLVDDAIGAPAHLTPRYDLVPVGGASQVSIDAATVGRAASQLGQLLQDLPGWYPAARGIHVFVTAPAALVARAVFQTNNSPIPIYLYEFFAAADGGARYHRMLDLKHGRLVGAGDSPDRP